MSQPESKVRRVQFDLAEIYKKIAIDDKFLKIRAITIFSLF